MLTHGLWPHLSTWPWGVKRACFKNISGSAASPRSRSDISDRMPTTMAYSGFLRRIAYEGSFHDIITVLLGIEWPYLEWGKRLESQGAKPGNKYYQTWIDLHAAKELDDFVSWMRDVLDSSTVGHPARLRSLFLSALRYEYMFWEMAYSGEKWPE